MNRVASNLFIENQKKYVANMQAPKVKDEHPLPFLALSNVRAHSAPPGDPRDIRKPMMPSALSSMNGDKTVSITEIMKRVVDYIEQKHSSVGYRDVCLYIV